MWDGFLYIFSGVASLTGFFLFMYATIRRVIKIERKFKELLPGHKGFVRLPPTFEILAIQKPPSEKGKEFLIYRKRYVRESLKIMAIGFGFMILGVLASSFH